MIQACPGELPSNTEQSRSPRGGAGGVGGGQGWLIYRRNTGLVTEEWSRSVSDGGGLWHVHPNSRQVLIPNHKSVPNSPPSRSFFKVLSCSALLCHEGENDYLYIQRAIYNEAAKLFIQIRDKCWNSRINCRNKKKNVIVKSYLTL